MQWSSYEALSELVLWNRRGQLCTRNGFATNEVNEGIAFLVVNIGYKSPCSQKSQLHKAKRQVTNLENVSIQ